MTQKQSKTHLRKMNLKIEKMKVKKIIHKSRLLAFKDEKLLVLEKIGHKKRYTLAGGVQKKRETDFHSLIRETEEEIGVLLYKEHY